MFGSRISLWQPRVLDINYIQLICNSKHVYQGNVIPAWIAFRDVQSLFGWMQRHILHFIITQRAAGGERGGRPSHSSDEKAQINTSSWKKRNKSIGDIVWKYSLYQRFCNQWDCLSVTECILCQVMLKKNMLRTEKWLTTECCHARLIQRTAFWCTPST